MSGPRRPRPPSDMLARMRGTVAAGSSTPEPTEAPPARRRRRTPADETVTPEPAPSSPPRTTPARQAATRPARRAAPAEKAPAEKPVHFTLDLARPQHRELRIAALDLGVDAAAIVRALLEEYAADQRLARRIAQRLQSGAGAGSR